MSDSKTLYKQLLKSTTLFGGVQVFNIVISILRSKLIALFIGPAGMGVAGLFSSTIELIYSATSLGLGTSGVKSISQRNSELKDLDELNKTISILKQLMWFTGILGCLVTLFFSSWISEFTFGNKFYTWHFAWLSLTLLFKNILNSNYAILQGTGKLKELAKANFYGSFIGLLITLPLYYYFGIDGIVPTIILSALITTIISTFYTDKIKINIRELSFKKLFFEGKSLVQLGIMLSLSGLMTTVSAYLLQIYISNTSGINEVGYYLAGMTLLNSYVGVIFTSMSTDYFPRLSAVANNEETIRNLVKHQATIAILIITPLICLFIPFASIIIKTLYTSEFIIIVSMTIFGILGMLFRAVSWAMGYILIAKGDSKMFIKTAIFFNVLFLAMNVFAYSFWGLEGLGISFCIYYIVHFFGLKILTLKIYNFYFDSQFYKLFLFALLNCVCVYGLNCIEDNVIRTFFLIVLVLISILFSLVQLNNKIGFMSLYNKLKK